MNTTLTDKPWLKIIGWLVLVGLAAVLVNWAAKRADDLWKKGP